MGPKRKTKILISEAKRRRLEKDRERKQRDRQNVEKRQKEQEKDTLAHRDARKDEDYRRKEQEKNTLAHQGARKNEDYRGKEQEKNTLAHRDARKDEDYRRKEQEKDTLAHRDVRKDEDYRRKEQEKNTLAHQDARKNEDYRGKEQEKNTSAHRDARKDEDYRRKEQEKDTLAHRDARKDEDYRRKEQEKDTLAHQDARKNEDYRGKEQEKNTLTHRDARKDEDYRRKEQERDTLAHRDARKDEEYRRKEQEKNTLAHQDARKDEDYRGKEQEKNTLAHRSARKDEDYRGKEQEKNTLAHRDARKDEDYRRKEQEKDTLAHRDARKDEEYRRKEQEKDTLAHRDARKDEDYRMAEQERNTTSHRETRLRIQEKWETFEQRFEIAVKEGPTNRCSSCDRLWFKHSLRKVDKLNLKERGFKQKFLKTVFAIDDSNTGEFCGTCFKHISKEIVPKMCVNNGLNFPTIPACLKDLTRLEERCISARIPFMQIHNLGVDKQVGLKGSIINVPVNVDEMVRVLPRNPQDTFTVQLKLKRRMQYKHHYMYENVCPRKIYDAATYLTDQKLYSELGIGLSHDCIPCEDYNSSGTATHDQIEKNNATSYGDLNENHIEDEENEPDNPGCQETLIDNDEAISFAPGEGHRPISVLLDPYAEELSFPKIFCGQPRNATVKLSYSEIANSEIRRYDRRAARVDHLLYAFKKSQLSQIAGALSIALRKKKKGPGLPTRAGDMLSNDYVNNLVQHDDGYKFLKGIRSAPAHWEKEKKRVLALIRQNGLPTLFITLSAAETRWPELIKILKQTVDKTNITIDEAKNMEYISKARLIREDPVTCALYFNHRFHELIKTWKSKQGPFDGFEILHYYYRIEFQHRGSPHVHMLIWLRDAPIFQPTQQNTFEDVEKFADNLISCKREDDIENLTLLQKHRHTSTCRKKTKCGHVCRFGIPFFPMDRTRILLPLKEDEVKEKEAEVLTNYKNIRSAIDVLENNSNSFDEFLISINLNIEDYILAIRSHLERPKMFLKRDPNETFINPYSKKILCLHRANMDIQFVLDAYACAIYIIDYINKSNRGISKVLKDVVEEVRNGNDTLRNRLKTVANAFINASEVSAQEAAWTLLRMPMSFMSDSDVYIPTSPPEERTRLIKSERDLRNLDPESTNIFHEGLLDRYIKRPQDLEEVCLADYAAYFDSAKREKQLFGDSEMDADIPLEETATYISHKRNKPRIIRYRSYSIVQDPDNFYRELLMLYLPWRNEEEELLKINCREKFEAHANIIQLKRKSYVYSDVENELITAIQAVEEREFENECSKADLQIDKEYCVLDYDPNELRCNIFQDIDEREKGNFETFKPPNKLPLKEYHHLMQKLNIRQYDFLMHVLSCFKHEESLPLHLFVTGPAGCGKSVLIQALHQTLVRVFEKRGSGPDDATVLLIAPTGKAAYSIHGITAHAAFALPLNQSGKRMAELSADIANTISSHFLNVKAIIIDEISMLGAKQFCNIHRRLQQIFKSNKAFGGMSMFVFGDFRQLPPVGDRYIFQVPSSDPIAELAGPTLWEKFSMYELNEIMRQKDDKVFASVLNHMADGTMTTEDINFIKERCIHETTSLPKDAIHLFATNAEVDAYNVSKLASMSGETCIATCFDFTVGESTDASKEAILKSAANKTLRDTFGLPHTIFLRVGAHYMITNNVDTKDGLVNGAIGVLKNIQYAKVKQSGEMKPYRLWILFDDPQTGEAARKNCKRYVKACSLASDLTPIDFITRTIVTRKTSNLQVQRKQFPVVPAEGITIHKSQGATYSTAVINLKTKMPRSQLYVACSRVTSASGLFIKGDFIPPLKPHTNDAVVKELMRLQKYKLIPKFQFLNEPRNCKQLIFHNVQSLHAHHELIAREHNFLLSDFLLFAETWTLETDSIDIQGFFQILRVDCQNQRKPYGVCAYAKSSLEPDISKVSHRVIQENTSGHIESCSFNFNNIRIVTLYSSPKTPMSLLKKFLKEVLIPSEPTILVGDFNIDFMSRSSQSFVSYLVHTHNLSLATQPSHPTTNANTAIDAVFTSIPLEVGLYESYFSHHKPIWVRFEI